MKPWLIADLLILRDEMPRSLASCYENLVQNLDRIAGAYGRQGPAQRQARNIRTRLQNSRMEEIFQSGLHEFIGGFINDNNALGGAVAEDLFRRGLCLPSSSSLSREDQDAVVGAVRACAGKGTRA